MVDKSMLRQLIDEKNVEYQKILIGENPDAISEVLVFLERAKRAVNSDKVFYFSEESERLSEEAKRIIALMDRYKSDIKQIFMESGECITHITTVSPDNLKDGKIMRSKNRANNYETEIGDWVFASSEPVDSTNAYLARKPGSGMICITPKLYIYGGDNIDVVNGRAFLKEPNYIYTINPEDFMPVVTLFRDNDGTPGFEFSEEWVSEHDVDINDKNQVSQVVEVRDITALVENITVLCDIHKAGIALKMFRTGEKNLAIQVLLESVKRGFLRYINGECGINVIPQIEEVRLAQNIDINLEGRNIGDE